MSGCHFKQPSSHQGALFTAVVSNTARRWQCLHTALSVCHFFPISRPFFACYLQHPPLSLYISKWMMDTHELMVTVVPTSNHPVWQWLKLYFLSEKSYCLKPSTCPWRHWDTLSHSVHDCSLIETEILDSTVSFHISGTVPSVGTKSFIDCIFTFHLSSQTW